MSNTTEQNLATRRQRAASGFIDFFLNTVLSTALVLLTGVFAGPEAYESGFAFLARFAAIASLGYALLNAIPLVISKQTIGQKLVGLTTVSSNNGAPVSLLRKVFRAALVVAFLVIPFGPILLLADPLFALTRGKRTLRDRLSRCVIVANTAH